MADSNLLAKVRKILSRTEESGCTEAEAASAVSLASRLLAEHNLSMDDVEAADDGDPSFVEADAFETGRWTLQQNLAWGICKEFFFVEGYLGWKANASGGNPRKRLILFGKKDNVETATFMFGGLLAAFDRLFDDYRSRTGCPASERRIFTSGVARGFQQKMREERRAFEIERDIVGGKTGTALALVGLKDQVAMAYKDAHPKLKPGRSNFAETRGTRSALQAGEEAGRNLNINRGIGQGKRKGISS